jgi:hydrogenase maturation protein HypF
LEVNKKIEISGLVQGVGFRPFIYQLASRYELKGYVRNNSAGVQIEIEGRASKIDTFMQALRQELPPLARIDSLHSRNGTIEGHTVFEIIHSEGNAYKSAVISPDIALCDTCQAEMNDPSNRRYNYPFINCTDCGPRYSIIETVPYDRPNTSMRFFTMCKQCEQEYANPLDRRFHAQPISCFECGPTLRLLDPDSAVLSQGAEAIAMAAQAILEGKIIALKGLGGFHLICDASSSEAVSRLRNRKKRPAKPFAVMFSDIQSLKTSADLSPEEESLVRSKEKPIVITSKRKTSEFCDEVAPGINRIGVFLPYTPLHHLILQGIQKPVVATSANLSDEPIIRDAKTIIQKLGHVVDFVLDHDREIINANDDSVTQVVAGKTVILRMARGFTPKSMILPFKSKKNILALGANQKDTITLVFEDKLILSPHIGDLNSIEAFEHFERTVETFKRIYDFTPEVIVCDKHPNDETTKWAHQRVKKDASLSFTEVQHHYAHLLAVKAEHRLSGKVLGFAFDGTGYGDGGTVWGAEVMVADEHEYERLYSLHPFRLLGGDKAVKEPRRSALSLLFEYLSLDEIMSLDIALTKEFSRSEAELLHKAWEKGLNAPYSSSMGRLFDAVASLSDIVHISSFEGESGLKMEAHVDASITQGFEFIITDGLIDFEPMVREIITMRDRVKMVSMFFNTLVKIIEDIAFRHTELPLVFSGGVFQNKVLVEKIEKRFKELGRNVCFQNETVINDGGISLGQAWFALHNL